jgi:hypothetical protein
VICLAKKTCQSEEEEEEEDLLVGPSSRWSLPEFENSIPVLNAASDKHNISKLFSSSRTTKKATWHLIFEPARSSVLRALAVLEKRCDEAVMKEREEEGQVCAKEGGSGKAALHAVAAVSRGAQQIQCMRTRAALGRAGLFFFGFFTHSACRSHQFVIEVKHAPRFEFPFVADFVGSEVRQIVLSGNHWHATPRVTCCW